MKKSTAIILIIGMSLLCIASVIVPICLYLFYWSSYYYDYNELKEKVVSVELIEYQSVDVSMTQNKNDIAAFDFGKSETLQSLEQNRIDKFCLAFSKVEFSDDEDFPNAPIGRCLKLTYNNGDFLIVIGDLREKYCYSGAHLYDKSGNIQEVVGYMPTIKDFYDLCDNFFGEVE